MGYTAHHAIIVTAETRSIRVFHAQAVATFAGTCAKVTAPTEAGMNATSSFLIAPDGSTEGWADSDAGDAARAAFIDYLTADQYYCVDWVEVRFGGDDSDTQTYVTRHSGDDEYYAERERLRAMRADEMEAIRKALRGMAQKICDEWGGEADSVLVEGDAWDIAGRTTHKWSLPPSVVAWVMED